VKGRVPKYHRKSIRIKGYDYSGPGCYYITICAKNRERIFGEIIRECMELNEGGKVVLSCWKDIPLHYPKVKLHQFIIMSNHIHGILEITNTLVGSENLHYEGPSDMIPHAPVPVVGVQDFEPLQEDHPHGESDELIQNIESMFNNHQNKRKSNRPKSGKLINEYQHIIPGSIGSIVRGFEIGVTKWFRKNTEIHAVWQRNFYETIIRSPKAYKNITKYIIDNPKNWEKDEFNDRKS